MKMKLQGENAGPGHPGKLPESQERPYSTIATCSEQSGAGICLLLLPKILYINESTEEWKLNQTI